jgi:hypothetical protein
VSRRSEPPVCGRCGETRPLHKRATAGHPDLCKRCYHHGQPRRPCGICGKTRQVRIRARDDQPDICNDCAPKRHAACGVCGRIGAMAVKATDSSPAIGRCCWRPAVAMCSSCARERRCYHATGPQPVCLSCHRGRRIATCLDCGLQRPAQRRVTGGVVCAPCDRRRGNTTGICVGCGGIAPLKRELCDACRLGERVAQLAAAGDRHAASVLAPYLAVLAEAPDPESTVRWLQTPTLGLLKDLLAGRIAVTHEALDVAQGDAHAGRAVGYVRAALVDAGVLEPRDEHSAAFARWQQRAVDAIPAGADRGHVRAYATWHVAHELARTSARGRATPTTQKHARSLVNEAIKLVLWLHEQQLELHDLRQDLLDTWIADGASTRRCVRMFLQWLARAGVTGELHVAWNTSGHGPAPLDDEQRFAALRRLLDGRDIDPRDRFAGLLLLLYAQPLTRTAALETTDIATTPDGQITIRLARGAVPLPEPLGSLAHALRDQRLASTGFDGWLLPGRKPGSHITAERLRERLKRYGIASRPSRHAALLALAARLPAPILAERLGFHQARAAQWVRAAGATYADYVALGHS